MGAGGASLGRLLSARCVLLFSGHLLLALGREEVLSWGILILPLTAVSTEKPLCSAEAVGITLLRYCGLKVMLCAC